jgi:hypothetical protein
MAKMTSTSTTSFTQNADGSLSYMGWADGSGTIQGKAMVTTYYYLGYGEGLIPSSSGAYASDIKKQVEDWMTSNGRKIGWVNDGSGPLYTSVGGKYAAYGSGESVSIDPAGVSTTTSDIQQWFAAINGQAKISFSQTASWTYNQIDDSNTYMGWKDGTGKVQGTAMTMNYHYDGVGLLVTGSSWVAFDNSSKYGSAMWEEGNAAKATGESVTVSDLTGDVTTSTITQYFRAVGGQAKLSFEKTDSNTVSLDGSTTTTSSYTQYLYVYTSVGGAKDLGHYASGWGYSTSDSSVDNFDGTVTTVNSNTTSSYKASDGKAVVDYSDSVTKTYGGGVENSNGLTSVAVTHTNYTYDESTGNMFGATSLTTTDSWSFSLMDGADVHSYTVSYATMATIKGKLVQTDSRSMTISSDDVNDTTTTSFAWSHYEYDQNTAQFKIAGSYSESRSIT